MKKYLFLLINFCIASAWAQQLNHQGCAYQGNVVQNKPHGKGVLTCPDGRIYTGDFVRGEFEGQGQYIVPNQHGSLIAPFGMNSDKLKNMVLVGHFSRGMAHGKFKVYQDGNYLFNFTFHQGIARDMKLAK